jgi:hypothetical protein
MAAGLNTATGTGKDKIMKVSNKVNLNSKAKLDNF